jgi:hypothetical protein
MLPAATKKEFKASLGYMVSSETLSQKRQKQPKKKKKKKRKEEKRRK